jgi:hypothetical protein
MLKVGIALCGLLIVGAALGASQTLSGGAKSSPSSFSRVSGVGTPLALPPGDQRTLRLRQGGFTAIETIGVYNERAFYRLETKSGKACYGTGTITAAWPLGMIKCSNGDSAFPSEQEPVLDSSIVGLDRGEAGLPHFIQIRGVAADGVATIAVRDAAGMTIASVPVTNNTYWLDRPPPGSATLAALDASGNVLATIPDR